MTRFLVLTILLVSPMLCRAQILGFVLPEGEKRVQFPIEVHNNLVVLPIILNGQLPLKFILDTGVRTAILTEKAYSDILNLPYTRKYTLAGPGGVKLVDAYVTTNVSLDMPGVHGQGHALLVLDQDYLELRNSLGTDVHGILGYELFSRFVVQIDYERKMLTLTVPEKFRHKRKYEEIPITVEDTKPYIIVNAEINDTTQVKLKLLVDSGASHGLILEADSDDKIIIPKDVISSVIGRGLGGAITGKIGRIKSLEIGHYKIPEVIANYPDPNSYMDTLKMNRYTFRNGAMGGEMLSRFNVIFDFPESKIFLKRNSSFSKKSYYNLSGLTIRAKGSRLRNFEISDVRVNSTAYHADLKIGDAILSVNGYSVEELELNNVNNLFNSKPGKKVVVEIERQGKKLRKEFRLESQI
jgi:Periplasmic protease